MPDFLKGLFFMCLLISSCTIPRKYQKNKPFVFKNTIDVNGGKFSSDQKKSLKQKLYGQLDDSSKVNTKDYLFLLHIIKQPPAYDSGYSAVSAKNMRGAMLHLGYYGAKVSFKADTTINGQVQPVSVKYTVEAGNPTLIDTISYRLKRPDLQQLALESRPQSFLVKGNAVTKVDILNEISRLVELYRNNGYYKITSDDLKMRGDTTIAALTNISDDPFANLELLAEANLQRDKPTVKLAVVLNLASDTFRLKKYYINNVVIYPDFTAADAANNTPYTEDTVRGFFIRYHKKIIRNSFLIRNMGFSTGDVYSQSKYAKTIGNFSKAGVWQNTNIQIDELKDSSGRVNMTVQLLPARKYGFEANIEASYSANSNTNTIANAGNLLGLSTNVSLQNRNVKRSGTKMTHSLRAGVELNLNGQQGTNRKLNSEELSYTNIISFPRLSNPVIWARRLFENKSLAGGATNKKQARRVIADTNYLSQQTFISVTPAYSNRLDLFKQLSASMAFGNDFVPTRHPNRKNTIKFLNIEYSYLYNQSDSFVRTLERNAYLRYSFNTALVIGTSYSRASTFINPKNPTRQHTIRWNIEESGLLLGRLKVFNKDLRQFIKADWEYTFIAERQNTSKVFRAFIGMGIPVGKGDTTLPFFKQYFAGGANSMRGWPIRGIGPGAKPLAPYNTTGLNDRTGDVKIELNGEYRYNILQIIPNSLVLKGALFIDAGNVWNFRNTVGGSGTDSLQFNLKTLYQQLGVTAGTGLRFDFNYFLLRFDLGFRFKRPDIAKNDGWQLPNINLSNLLSKGDENKIWRYENFNFTIGLSYPF